MGYETDWTPADVAGVAGLVERLREKAKDKTNSAGDKWGDWVCDEAAARIEALTVENEVMRAQLKKADGLDAAVSDNAWRTDFEKRALTAYREARHQKGDDDEG